MPKIVRWFRVTQDINQDPEMWELREAFGDRAGFVWLECLSIADRNEGLVGPNSPQLHAVLASKCRVYSPKVRAILGWLLGKGWLIHDDSIAREVGTNSPPITHEHATNMERTIPIRTKFTPSSCYIGEYLRVANWLKYNGSRKSIGSPPNPPFPIPSPNPSPKKSPPPPTEALECAQLLLDKIQDNFPNHTAPTEAQLMNWARDADKINRLDNHPWPAIREMVAWAQADSFWRANILSMGKLREKWNQLVAKKEAGDGRNREAAEPKGFGTIRSILRKNQA